MRIQCFALSSVFTHLPDGFPRALLLGSILGGGDVKEGNESWGFACIRTAEIGSWRVSWK